MSGPEKKAPEEEVVEEVAEPQKKPEYEFSLRLYENDSAHISNVLQQVGHDWSFGHVWVSIHEKSDPKGGQGWGFYPESQLTEAKAEDNTAGLVEYAQFDVDDSCDFMRTWDISNAAAEEIMRAGTEAFSAPPEYNLFSYNATDFAEEMAEMAQVTLPEASFFRIEDPRQIMDKLRRKKTTGAEPVAADLTPDEE